MAANQAVVGVLRAMLTADTASFDTGMGKANTTLKLVETNTKKVGAEVAKLTPQAERMVKAFSGDKLLYSANSLVTAITKIGGATKLTTAEQARANKTLTDAIAKYAAMGQVAPQAMLDLERATRGVTQATSAMTAGMSAAAKQSASSINLIGGMSKAGREAAASLTSVEKAMSAMTAGMSAAAKQSAASIQMIGGMSAAGRQAAAQAEASTRRMSGTLLAGSQSATMMSGAVQGLTRNLGAYVGIAALGGGIIKTIEYAGALEKASIALGATGTATQRLENIAVGSNTTLDAMTSAITMMQDRLAGGDTSAVKALERLGLTVKQVFALNPDQQFILIAKALQEIHSSEQQIQLGKDIFGRGAVEVIGALRGEVDQLADSVRVLSTIELKQLQQAEQAWDNLWLAAKRYSGLLLSDLMNPLGTHAARVGPFAPVEAPDLPRAPILPTQPGFTARGPTDAEIREIDDQLAKINRQRDEQLAKLKQQRAEAAALADALFGRDVIARANDLASALGSIGNVSLLSAEKQREVHEAVTAAIATYERMGQVAPDRLRVIAEATTTLLVNTTDTNAALRNSMALYEAMPAAINSAAASIEGRLIPAMHGVAALFEATARAKASIEELTEGGFISAPAAIVSEGASAEAQRITQEQTEERLEQQRDQIVAFWKAQAGALESATLGRLGTLFFGQMGHDVEGTLKAAADEAHQDFLKIQRDGKATAEELTLAFNRWREAEERATFTFGERFSQWMGGLKQTFVSILDDMLQYFVKTFLGGLLKGLSSAKLAQGLGNALAGGGTGALLGGGASAASSVGGAAGGGGGLLALATNPWTIGAAGAVGLGLLIAKKGLFRGGEEAININPRRDQFFGQLQAMFGGTQFEAAVMASQKAKIPGGTAERMIGAVYSADSKNEYESAQFAFLNALQAGGLKNVRGFATGGFVPPGVVQPAILHGGRFGEDIVPRTSAGSGAKIELHQHYNTTFNSHAMNTEGFDRVFKNEFLPRLHFEYRLNQQGTVTVLEKAMAR